MDPIADHADKAPPAGGPNPPRDFTPYPKLDPADVNPPPPPSSPPASKSVTWSSDLTRDPPPAPTAALPEEPNPYIASSPVPSPAAKSTIDNMRDMLGRWGKRAAEVSKKAADVTAEASKKAVDATRKAEDLAGNVWQHLRTGPSFAEAAMGRIAQGTKVIAEGGYEKIFRHTFDSAPDEQLKNSFACYLSTSAGPVMGVLYLSTAKLAFCSDNPLSYKVGDQTEWSYYKVVIPLDQLRGANPSTSSSNVSEKYVQIVSIDNHEFWFMGFVNYSSAVESLQEALHEARDMQP